jgi:hypothetical protein
MCVHFLSSVSQTDQFSYDFGLSSGLLTQSKKPVGRLEHHSTKVLGRMGRFRKDHQDSNTGNQHFSHGIHSRMHYDNPLPSDFDLPFVSLSCRQT